MKQIGIEANTGKPQALAAAKTAYELLKSHGCQPVYEHDTALSLGEEPCRDTSALSCAVVIGGDGTVLRAAKRLAPYGTPILGINLGTVGFLSEIEADAMPQALAQLAQGGYRAERRVMLHGVAGGHASVALNDFTLFKRESCNILSISVRIDGDVVWNFACDGVIISTPTGSTAYSLSAGGPIIAHDASCILLTPVCPHVMAVRPMVVGDGALIEARLTDGAARVSCDGQQLCEEFGRDDALSVRVSDVSATFVDLGANSFYDRIRYKLY